MSFAVYGSLCFVVCALSVLCVEFCGLCVVHCALMVYVRVVVGCSILCSCSGSLLCCRLMSVALFGGFVDCGVLVVVRW